MPIGGSKQPKSAFAFGSITGFMALDLMQSITPITYHLDTTKSMHLSVTRREPMHTLR